MRRLAQALRKPAAGRPVGQLLRYGIVVGFGYLLAIAIYAGELEVGVPPYLALGVAFVLNGLFNFAWLRVWAFPPSGRGWVSDLRRFCVVAAASFLVNYASFAVLYSAIGLGAGTSQRLAILIAAPVTFLANRIWAFRARHKEPPPLAYEAAETAARNESYSRM
jgi:putative flippase GtrA